MNSGSNSSASEKLADRRWRLWNSWWVWVPLVSCGLLPWLGFVFAGVRFGERRYWITAAAFGATTLVGVILISLDETGQGTLSDVATVPIFGGMFGAAVVAGVWNRDYLIKLANRNVWPPAQPTSSAQQFTTPPTQFLGVSQDSFYAPPAPAHPQSSTEPTAPAQPQASRVSGPAIDLNVASVDDLVSGLGITKVLATQIVSARNSRGGFRSLEDLISGAGLQPHELVQLRDRVTFGARRPNDPPAGNTSSGRILDF